MLSPICAPTLPKLISLDRTIHQMVYSAMKLFMEINPTLFDECTNEYAQEQENAPQRQADRENVWKMLEEKANQKRKGGESARGLAADVATQPRGGSPMQISDDGAEKPQKEESKKAVGEA